MIRIRKELGLFVIGVNAIAKIIDLIFFKILNFPNWIFTLILIILGILAGYLIFFNILQDNKKKPEDPKWLIYYIEKSEERYNYEIN